jgi:hypothetical protein
MPGEFCGRDQRTRSPRQLYLWPYSSFIVTELVGPHTVVMGAMLGAMACSCIGEEISSGEAGRLIADDEGGVLEALGACANATPRGNAKTTAVVAIRIRVRVMLCSAAFTPPL